jgi:site-specific DNA recombinase
MASDDQNRILIIPWTPPSPYRRREIIQGEGDRPSATRPMRTEARAVLTDALRDAHRWLDELTTSPNLTIESLAARERKTERWIRRTISLAFLCHALVKAAIDGRLPRGFGVKRLMDPPMAWTDQWSAFGLRALAERWLQSERLAISLIGPAVQSGTQNSASETHFRVRRPRPVVPAE